MVKLRNIDLNLLVTLDTLLDEAHVGRAADRLGLSQPAASNALARARLLFDDPLLVRAPPNGLRRTPRAEALRGPLRAALAELSVLVDAAPPDPADLRGVVRLVAPDIPAAALGSALATELARSAPGVDLIFHPWHAGDEVVRLERGEIDLVVAVSAFFGASLRTSALGSYPYRSLMRQDHPAASDQSLSIGDWLAFPHVVVSGRGDPRGSIDVALARIGRERRVAVVVPTFLHAVELLGRTDLIGNFPSAALTSAAARHLVSCDPPIPIEPVELHLVRHRRTDPDAVVTLVADIIARVSPGLNEPEIHDTTL